jgi:hypothetical protein
MTKDVIMREIPARGGKQTGGRCGAVPISAAAPVRLPFANRATACVSGATRPRGEVTGVRERFVLPPG